MLNKSGAFCEKLNLKTSTVLDAVFMQMQVQKTFTSIWL
jgi:hypothetical protein